MDNVNNLSGESAAAMMGQLGNLTRLRILRLLVRAEPSGMSVGAIGSNLKVPASTLSHHLSGLCRIGLVRQKRDGATLCCHAQMQRLDELSAFLTEECCAGLEE